MTNNQNPVPAAGPLQKHASKITLVAIVLGILILLSIVLGLMTHYTEDSRASQSDSMQKSLVSHGFNADAAVAKLVSDGCRYKGDAYPVSTTIVRDYNGKKSVITFMCDGNAKISDFAAVPAG